VAVQVEQAHPGGAAEAVRVKPAFERADAAIAGVDTGSTWPFY